MSWRVGLMGLGVVLTGLVAGILPGLLGEEPEVPTLIVRREPFVRRVMAEGVLQAVHSTSISLPGGRARRPQKIAWMVPDGSLVEAGDVIVRFDATTFEEEIATNLLDSRIAEGRITKAEIEREGTLVNLDRDVEILEQEAEDTARFQPRDPQIFSRIELVESEIDTDLAAKRAEHAATNREIKDELLTADLELQRIRKRQSDLQLEEARENLASLTLTAPSSGLVVFERDYRGDLPRVGETVWPRRPIASIPDLSEMMAEIYVLEADAGGLEVGQRAVVVIEAHPEHPVKARVASVDPIAKQRMRGVPVQYFRAELELEHTDPALMKPGQRVQAEIILDERDQAITVPRQAICSLKGRTVVYRCSGSGFEPVEVTLGESTLGRVVVDSGLSGGDCIALRDPRGNGLSEPGAGASGPGLGGPA
jgi:multidrug efflux pump subunit AcrA (membrane-fusion protein)